MYFLPEHLHCSPKKTEKAQARNGRREDEVRQKAEVSLIPLSISKFLIFIPFTAASTLACWHGWCYFSFRKGDRIGLTQVGGGGNRTDLPGRLDSVTISQTSIGACEVLSVLLIVSLFSFPLVFSNVLPQCGVTTSWHKWQTTSAKPFDHLKVMRMWPALSFASPLFPY